MIATLACKIMCTSSLRSLQPVCLYTNAFIHHWIIYSGATDHITFHFNNLLNPVPINSSILLPNGQNVAISHKGTVKLFRFLSS